MTDIAFSFVEDAFLRRYFSIGYFVHLSVLFKLLSACRNTCSIKEARPEVGIYKRKQESKKTRKQAFEQESDQEKKKEKKKKKRSRPKKRSRKKTLFSS